MARALSIFLFALTFALGCRGPSEPTALVPSSAPSTTTPQAPPAVDVDVDVEPPPTSVHVLISDPAVLRRLEHAGLGAGAMAFGRGDASIASFVDTPSLTVLRRALKNDLAAQRRADPKAEVGMRHPHRLFDLSWLDTQAAKTRFELIAVVNRADRQPFAPEHCGETRLVYRLAYETQLDGERVDSRLPMTLNVVFWQDAADCSEAATRWLAPEELEGAALAQWLLRDEGPLAPSRLARSSLEAVETNLQILRWPGVMHPSLGGHAAYALRVFRPTPDSLAPAPLENTPDVRALRKTPAEREALLAWLRDEQTLAALDAGTAVMPERFAATVVESVAPRGFGRIANRPFSQLFEASDFDTLALDGFATISTPAGLLRRLDGLSCNGCHESRSVAGFHMLGESRQPDQVLDAMWVSTSPHLDGDLERRAQWVRSVARGEAGDPTRPLSDFERHRGAYGSHCGLGDAAFASWTCAPELSCVALDDPDMGTCLTPERGAGDPCELGELHARSDPTRDRLRDMQLLECEGGAVCNATKVGFPGGMCTKRCTGLDADEACGAIVNLRRFNDCIAAREPFPRCIERAAGPAGMRRCNDEQRCRDDYICARSPMDPETGVCIPPYFLFQMRIDGHVL